MAQEGSGATAFEGYAQSPSASAQGYGAISTAEGVYLIEQEPESVFQSNVGNTLSQTFVDAGALETAKQIALSGISEASKATEGARSTLGYTIEKMSELVQQKEQGQATTLVKALGWIAAALFALWLGFKFFSSKRG